MQPDTRNNAIVATIFIAISLITGSLIWAFVNTMEKTGERIEHTAEESKRDVRDATNNITAAMQQLVIIKQNEIESFEKIFNNISNYQESRLEQTSHRDNETADRFESFVNTTEEHNAKIILGFKNLTEVITAQNIHSNSTAPGSGSPVSPQAIVDHESTITSETTSIPRTP